MNLINPYLYATGGGGDPYWAYVTALITNEGTNGSQPSTAVVGGTITYTGDAALTTTYYPTGQTSSLAVDGAGTPKDSAWIASGTGTNLTTDFTAELWFRMGGTANNSRLLDIGANKFSLFVDGAATSTACYLYCSDGGGYLFLGTSLGNLGTTNFHHIAVSRTSGTVKLWLDGVQKGSDVSNSSTLGATTNGLTLGCYFKGDSNGFNGSIGPHRLTNGIGRYSAAFTPPTLPLPES